MRERENHASLQGEKRKRNKIEKERKNIIKKNCKNKETKKNSKKAKKDAIEDIKCTVQKEE